MIEILPDLWICKNKQLKKYDDNYYLINCSESLSFLGKFKEYKDEIKQNILKYEIVQLYKFIISTIDKIHDLLLNNRTIIVSCNTSLQLSPLVIIAYIIKYGKLEKLEAITLFKTKKPDLLEDDLFFHNILNKINNDN
jgi:hypothetical protein|tara:strand:- start:76 stop:489 length:414 start_codon:yes stop_codon:yes gene_type:complete